MATCDFCGSSNYMVKEVSCIGEVIVCTGYQCLKCKSEFLTFYRYEKMEKFGVGKISVQEQEAIRALMLREAGMLDSKVT